MQPSPEERASGIERDLLEITGAMAFIDPNECDLALKTKFGLGLKATFGEVGRDLFVCWLKSSSSHERGCSTEIQLEWDDLKANSRNNLLPIHTEAMKRGWDHGLGAPSAADSSREQSIAYDSSREDVMVVDSCQEQQGAGERKPGEISRMVESFMSGCDGIFQSYQVVDYVSAKNRAEKNAVYNKLNRLRKANKINKIGGRNHTWEVVEDDFEVADLDVVETELVKLPFPLGISNIAGVREGEIVLIQGETNSGKTVLMMHILDQLLSAPLPPSPKLLQANIDNKDKAFRYLFSEGKGEFKSRMLSLGKRPLHEWVAGCAFIERTRAWHQLIHPNGITFVDYLNIREDFTDAKRQVDEIAERLERGVAIVAMQKRPGKAHGVGGYGVMDAPRLVLTLEKTGGDTGELTRVVIEKGKHRGESGQAPDGLYMDFKITKDCKIVAMSDLWSRYNIEKRRSQFNSNRG